MDQDNRGQPETGVYYKNRYTEKANCAVVAWWVLAWILTAGIWRSAEGVPAFARKYETSCMTCHVAHPKLNAFGEAFRLNGFQIPESEEELSKDPGVALGSDGWKRVWPDGVWPGRIPETPPLAARGETGFEYERDAEVDRQFERPSVTLYLAGTMEEDISFYTGIHLFEEGEFGSLGRAYVQFSSLLANWWLPPYLLNIRIGQFIPEAVPFANHRGLTLTPYATNVFTPGSELAAGHVHGGGEKFIFESNQVGVEVKGVVRSRWRYSVGLVNGSGGEAENNNAKDGYFRLAYKHGGMGFDGSGGAVSMSNATSLVDNALTVGGFGYLGALDNQEAGPKDLKVRRLGGDISLTYGDLNLFGVYALGRDERAHEGAVEEVDFTSWFVETDYGIYPWLIGVVRYESSKPDEGERLSRIVPHLTLLPRANMKILLETTVDPDDAGFDLLMTRLDFAF